MSAAPTRIGLIGSGAISQQYLSNLTTYPDVVVAGLAGRNAATVAEQAARHGVTAMTTEQLLADDSITVVVNLTPPAAHLEIGLAAIAAGKHVWSEKPLGATLAEAETLVTAARDRGVHLGGAPDTFLGAAHQRALSAIDGGSIGTPRSASAVMQYWGPDMWHPNPAFLFGEGAGPLLDMGPYWLTLLSQVFGSARSVFAHGRISRPERTIAKGPLAGTTITPTVPTYVTALIAYESGASATCIFSFEAERKEFSLEVAGDRGVLAFADPNEFDGEPSVIHRGEASAITGFAELEGAGRGVGVVDFVRSIRASQPARTDARLGLHVLEILTAIERSASVEAPVAIASRIPSPRPLADGWSPFTLA